MGAEDISYIEAPIFWHLKGLVWNFKQNGVGSIGWNIIPANERQEGFIRFSLKNWNGKREMEVNQDKA